jgi:hypothetical protein
MGLHIWQKRGPFIVCLGNFAQIDDEEGVVALVVLQVIVNDVIGFIITAVEFDVVFLEKGVSEQLVGSTNAVIFWGLVHIRESTKNAYIVLRK